VGAHAVLAEAAQGLDVTEAAELLKAAALQVGEVLEYKLKYLGAVAARGERFYLFARLDPYEQAELRKKAGEGKPQADARAATSQPAAAQHPAATDARARPRRASAP